MMGGLGVSLGADVGLGASVCTVAAVAAGLGFVAAVVRTVGGAPGSADGGVLATGISVEMAPLVQICSRFALFISKTITPRFGSRGATGRAICLPLIVI